MKKSYTYITMLLAVFALVSCVKELDNPQTGAATEGAPIEFTISDDATRALLELTDGKSVSWEDGDQVGLYYRSRITDDSGNVDTFVADNVPYKYDAQTGKFVPVGEPAKWTGGEEGEIHSLFVYFPYTSDAEAYNGIPRTISTTQSYNVTATSNPIASLGFAGSRVMEATYGQAVKFPAMSQSFAILRLNITNTTGADVTVSNVAVSNDTKNLAGNRTMSMAQFIDGAPRTIGTTGSQSITVNVENGLLNAGECIDVRLVVLPGDYSSSKFTVTVTSDKGEHPVVEFDGGNIAIGGRASKNIVLQAPSEAETPEYEIGQAVGGGVLYKIDGNTGYVLYPYRGASGVWETAVSYCEGVATTTGESWYLPTEAELNELFNIYTANDNPDGSLSTPTNFKVAPSTLAEKYLKAREAFDNYILSCASDGHVLNSQEDTKSGDCYWSSTVPNDATKAKMVRFGSHGSMSKAKTDTYYARCIKSVDLTALDESETDAEETYPAPIAGEEGEYDVYLLIGQSNMAGRGELLEDDLAEIPDVYLLDSEGNPVAAKNPMNIYSSIRKSDDLQLMGPGASFASTITAQTEKKVLLVVNARGGTAIAQWAKGASSSITVGNATTATDLSFYDEAVRRTQQAMEYGALKGILWHQGCSDQSNTSYMTKLTALANNLREDLGADVPFIVGQLGDWRSSSVNFNTNIKYVSNYLPYSDWVSSQGGVPIVTEDSNGEPDLTDPHFNRASQITMGKRYAQKILKMVYEKDYTVE